MIRISRNTIVACLAFAVAAIGLMAAPQAQAQIGITNAASPTQLIGGNRAAQKNTSAAPQGPALPGAQSNPDDVAKATNTDLQPTDALFDAVNRGDIATARDAISRGADLTAHNVLGMTPLDLSVDLSRNDITFLLLSLRGPSTPSAPLTQTAAATKPTKPTGKPSVTKVAERRSSAGPRTQAHELPIASPNQAKVLREFVSTGPGTPVPQDGFLGFGH